MGFFNKASSGQEEAPFKPDPRKARRFFEHAQAVAEGHNYDYAIDCYVNGLKHEPDNLDKHEALHEIARKRKVGGGKPAGMLETMKSGGKAPWEKMAHAELIWSKDPFNPAAALAVMKAAVEVQRVGPDLRMGEIINWIADMVIGESIKKPTKQMYVEMVDMLEAVDAFETAINACRLALQFDNNDGNLLKKLKDLEAENTMNRSGFDRAGEEGGFRDAVRSVDKQRALDQDDQIGKSDQAVDETIARRKAEFEENPEDVGKLNRLIDILVQKGTDESENLALRHLREAWEHTGQYRHKVRLGDIRMRQMNRHARELKAKYDANPGDPAVKQKFQELLLSKLQFELDEYTERIKNYPTDMGARYELGKRQHAFKKYDEAIASFQEAQADAKFRVASMQYLGMCYLAKGWFDEANDTLSKAITTYPISDDRMALDLRYLRMDALDNAARKSGSLDQAREALALASQIVQANINHKDIRQRLDVIRKLVEELQNKTQ